MHWFSIDLHEGSLEIYDLPMDIFLYQLSHLRETVKNKNVFQRTRSAIKETRAFSWFSLPLHPMHKQRNQKKKKSGFHPIITIQNNSARACQCPHPPKMPSFGFPHRLRIMRTLEGICFSFVDVIGRGLGIVSVYSLVRNMFKFVT